MYIDSQSSPELVNQTIACYVYAYVVTQLGIGTVAIYSYYIYGIYHILCFSLLLHCDIILYPQPGRPPLAIHYTIHL